MPVAIPIAAAAVGAAAKIGSAKMAGNKAKKAAGKAAETQAKQTAANTALSQSIYKTNMGLYAPSIAQGQQAGNVLMSALGLAPMGGGDVMPTGGGGGSALAAYQPPDAATQLEYLLKGSADVIGPKRTKKIMKKGGTPEERLQYALSLTHPAERSQYDTWMMNQQPSIYEQAGLGANGMGGGSVNPQSALDTYLNSLNYGFIYNQGLRGVENAFGGTFDSGAAGMAVSDYGQNTAQTYMGQWMDRLGQQQTNGLNSTANAAQAGNTMYGQVSGTGQDAADAKMNQYGVGAQAAANTWKAVGSGIGQVAGAVGGAFGGPAGMMGNMAGGMSDQQYAQLNASQGSSYGG